MSYEGMMPKRKLDICIVCHMRPPRVLDRNVIGGPVRQICSECDDARHARAKRLNKPFRVVARKRKVRR